MSMSGKFVGAFLGLSAGVLIGWVASQLTMAPDPPGTVVDSNKAVGVVILMRSGEAKKSAVHKIGPYCFVSWYEGIEKLLLNADGTADDRPFYYRWEVDRPGLDDPPADRAWFGANCAQPPPDRTRP